MDTAFPRDVLLCRAFPDGELLPDVRELKTYLVTSGKHLYESDEQAWAEAQIAALRARRYDDLDTETLAECLYEMTLSNQRELGNRLKVLLLHMLEIMFQADRLTPSWINTIESQKSEIADLLEEVPGLRTKAQGIFEKSYAKAVREAARETGIAESAFPVESPWTFQQTLNFRSPKSVR